ncbi:MAG: phosphotransferase [Fimbriimonadaceae bacterium]|nr:phosphotransferase [Fimbriimonadaceae bacterium]
MDAALSESDLRSLLLAAGLLTAEQPFTWELLGGGISNDVVAVEVDGVGFVLKRALPKLRVAADWRSDVTRIHREATCQRWLQQVLRPGEVPAVVWECHQRHVFIMARAPRAAVNWKDELLAGRVCPSAAARAGDLLGRVHAAGRRDEAIRAALADLTVFDQLRLDPYLREIARRHPSLAESIEPLVARLQATPETIVHGDFSPKNLLCCESHLVLLDHEVAHRGDPRFDLGFFFTHLLLKALHLGLPAAWAQVGEAWEAYRSAYPWVHEGGWLPFLGAMLLARVDGKSPAGYLNAETEERVRRLARPLLLGQVSELAEVLRLARGV